MSSPDEVAREAFAAPDFARLPPACGAPHPTREDVHCVNPIPCYETHFMTTWSMETGPDAIVWENPAKAPKREPNISKAKDIAKKVDENVERPPVPVNVSLQEALRRVERNANTAFMDEAKEVLRVVAHHMAEFTSEDVLERVQATTHDNRAMGPVMTWGKAQGLIEKTERFSQYRKQSNHQQDTRIWRSLVHVPVAQLADAECSNHSPSGVAGSSPAGDTTTSVTMSS